MAEKTTPGGGDVTNANTPAAINAQVDQCMPYLITPWCRANTIARLVAIRLAKLFATAKCAGIDATILASNTVSRNTYVHRAGRVETSRLFLSTLACQPQVPRTSPLLLWRLGQHLRRWLPQANEDAQSANTTSSSTNGATTSIFGRIPDGASSAAEYVRDLVAK